MSALLGTNATKRARMTEGDKLTRLHAEIDSCTVCSAFIPTLKKPTALIRGDGRRVMVVGQAPASREMAVRRAFAGHSGKRLDEWLVGCGAARAAPRMHCYLTSIVKCVCPSHAALPKMVGHCLHFLQAQAELIRPRLVITLGGDAFGAVDFTDLAFTEARYRVFESETYTLFPSLGRHFRLLVWPHPSGRSTVLNDVGERRRLHESFEVVRAALSED